MHRVRLDTNAIRLLVWAVFALAATLFPFNFGAEPAPREILYLGASELEVLDGTLNVLLFMPLGMLLISKLHSPAMRSNLITAAVVASAFAFSLCIEVLQQSLPTRSSSFVDVVTNTFGALIGARVYLACGPSLKAWGRRLRCDSSLAFRGSILAGCSVIALLLSGILQYRARPNNWDEGFFLLVGNEYTGDRPWRGHVIAMDWSDVSTPEALARGFARGDFHDVRAASVAAFKFAGKTQFHDAIGNLPPLRWVGSEYASSLGGAKLGGANVTERAWLQSSEPPRQIARRIQASNEFTVRIVCSSDSAYQDGPARIVSYSIDPMRRNFTIGQERSDMVIRLRTPNTGENGMHVPLVIPNVFSSNAVRDILVTYSGSTLTAAIADSNQVHSLEFNPGVILASLYLRLPQLEHFRYFKGVYYGVLFLLQLGLLALLTPNRTVYVITGMPWLVTFGLALEETLALTSPRPFDWTNFGTILTTGAIVLLTIWAMFGRPAAADSERHYFSESAVKLTQA